MFQAKCKHCLASIVEAYKGAWKHKDGQDNSSPTAHAAEPLFAADESLASLRDKQRFAAAEAAEASVEVAVHDRKKEAARLRYDRAKAQRDELKRAIAEHPES